MTWKKEKNKFGGKHRLVINTAVFIGWSKGD